MAQKRKKIPSVSGTGNTEGVLSDMGQRLHDLTSSRNEDPYISLKYYESGHECFSSWTRQELQYFSRFVNKLNQSSWTDIRENKGFGMKYHRYKDALPRSQNIETISPDIQFFELRVSKKARVHGFRCFSTFFLVWLDRNHQIYPQ